MLTYIIRRLLMAIPIILGVLFLTFLLFFFVNTPENIARTMLGEKAQQETIDEWIRVHGYDKPRFFNGNAAGLQKFSDTQVSQYFYKNLTFQFGVSDSDHVSIAYKIRKGVGPSLAVTVPAFLLQVVLAILVSLTVAMFRGNYIDRTVLIACVIGISLVYFIYIIAGQYYFARILKWFPISGWDAKHIIHFLTLPWIIGLLYGLGDSVRLYRTIMVNEVSRDYVRTARAKGVRNRWIMMRHLLKNSLIPILTGLVISIPALFTGSLLLESFFSIPGLGRMLVDAIALKDFTSITALVYISSLMFILFNLLTDICYTLVDPRVRLN